MILPTSDVMRSWALELSKAGDHLPSSLPSQTLHLEACLPPKAITPCGWLLMLEIHLEFKFH